MNRFIPLGLAISFLIVDLLLNLSFLVNDSSYLEILLNLKNCCNG